MVKTLDLPSYSELSEFHPHPTLTGKLLVTLIGMAGGGNGRCLTSTNLPKPASVVFEDRWLIHAYHLEFLNYRLHVTIDLVDQYNPPHLVHQGVVYKVKSDELAVSDDSYEEARCGQVKHGLLSIITQRWGAMHSESDLKALTKTLKVFLKEGRQGGHLLLNGEGLFLRWGEMYDCLINNPAR